MGWLGPTPGIDGRLLEERSTRMMLRHLANLWGYPVSLAEVDPTSEYVLNAYEDVDPELRLA
jgi:stage V sporulation protein R